MSKKFVPGPMPKGHVVEEYKFGNTRCRICDDYCCNKTPEDVKKILDRIEEIAYPALLKTAIGNGEFNIGNYEKKERLADVS